jgi:hypothetical protein
VLVPDASVHFVHFVAIVDHVFVAFQTLIVSVWQHCKTYFLDLIIFNLVWDRPRRLFALAIVVCVSISRRRFAGGTWLSRAHRFAWLARYYKHK